MMKPRDGSRPTPLVDLTRGIVSREIFVSEEIYAQEQERIFTRAWLFIGHESQIPKPGDYFVSRMGEESVILCRDRQDQIHVLLNSCRHRGMKVCRYDEGNTPVFTCPYHGWSYAPDGKLVGVPYFKEAYAGKLDKSQWGLIEVAQMANYQGFIWATWDPSAPCFEEYLGGVKPFLDAFLAGSDGGENGLVILGGVQKWRMPCNWKFPAENFNGDGYHSYTTHRGAVLSGIRSGRQDGKPDLDPGKRQRFWAAFPEGHGALAPDPAFWDQDIPYTSPYTEEVEPPAVRKYYRQAWEQRKVRLGWRTHLASTAVGTIFPNLSWGGGPRSVAVWHPCGPATTEAWRFYFVDRDAPPEVVEHLLRHQMRHSGPAGIVEQDDMENWNYASEASRGTIARRHPYHYAQGQGFEEPLARLPGALTTTGASTEQNQRGFYQRWSDLMTVASGRESARRDDPPGDAGHE